MRRARRAGARGRATWSEARRLATALELAWDGEWYRRGYYDDGTPLGSAQNDECKIDSIAQSWAVLSGAVPQRFAERAMDAVRTALIVRRESQLLLLLDPPFDRSAQDPGYIKGYPPGVRENGGQYTHAAVWIVMALARSWEAATRSAELFHMLNPINHTRTAADVERYKGGAVRDGRRRVRPTAARRARRLELVHGIGRHGCIGPAIESMLGLRRRGTHFSINPCIPSSWPAYEITWRVETTRYVISVSNPGRLCRGVVESSVDGVGVNPDAIPLVLDGGTHQVRIRLGTVSESAKATAFPEPAAAVLPAGAARTTTT